MSRNGTLLPLPDDHRLAEMIAAGLTPYGLGALRSAWLSDFEYVLRVHFPQASRADLNLTARHHAPFALALGPNVP